MAVEVGTGRLVAAGTRAKEMLGRAPGTIRAVRPLRDGVVSDADETERMLRWFIDQVRTSRLVRPRMVLCVPSDVTGVERRALEDAATRCGARRVYMIEEPMAAAIGAGLPVYETAASMVVDIGGGTTDVAVISLGGIVTSNSLRIAGDEIDEALIGYVKSEYSLLLGRAQRGGHQGRRRVGLPAARGADDPPARTRPRDRPAQDGAGELGRGAPGHRDAGPADHRARPRDARRVPTRARRRHPRPRHHADRRRGAAARPRRADAPRARRAGPASPTTRSEPWPAAPAAASTSSPASSASSSGTTASSRMQPTVRRRLLVVLASLTVALLVADLAHLAVADGGAPGGRARARARPTRALAGAPRDDLAALESENVRLRAVGRRAAAPPRRARTARRAARRGRRRPGAPLVPARVVATDVSAARRSQRDDRRRLPGRRPDRLDGRGRRRSRRSRRVRVAVDERRAGARQHRLGRGGARRARRHARHGGSPPAPGDSESRPRGSLTGSSGIAPSTPVVGDVVRTLGSVDETPYAAGIVVGTVTAVDPDRGQLTRACHGPPERRPRRDRRRRRPRPGRALDPAHADGRPTMRPTLLGLLRTAYVLVAALVVGDAAAATRCRAPVGARPRARRGRGDRRAPRSGARCPRGAAGRVGRRARATRRQPARADTARHDARGARRGLLPRASSRSPLRAPAALLAAAAVVLVGRLGSAVLAEGSVELTDGLWRLLVTVLVGGLLLPGLPRPRPGPRAAEARVRRGPRRRVGVARCRARPARHALRAAARPSRTAPARRRARARPCRGHGQHAHVTEHALRGRILDRTGTPFVDNTFDTVVTVQRSVLARGGRRRTRPRDPSRDRVLGQPFERLWGKTMLCGTAGAPPAPGVLQRVALRADPRRDGRRRAPGADAARAAREVPRRRRHDRARAGLPPARRSPRRPPARLGRPGRRRRRDRERGAHRRRGRRRALRTRGAVRRGAARHERQHRRRHRPPRHRHRHRQLDRPGRRVATS